MRYFILNKASHDRNTIAGEVNIVALQLIVLNQYINNYKPHTTPKRIAAEVNQYINNFEIFED